MKKHIFLSCLSVSLISCGPSSKEAIFYNDGIMGIVNKVTVAQNNFFDQTDGHNIDSLVICQKLYAQKSKESLDEIAKLNAFANKTGYLDAAKVFVNTLNSLANNEAKQMVEIMTKDTSSVTELDIKTVSDLSDKLNKETDEATKLIEDAQQQFVKEWKFELDHNHDKKHHKH